MSDDEFDPTFDTASDAAGRDPDKHSARLHAAHWLLWSKPLPSGRVLTLADARPSGYLLHDSELGRFHLGSDSIVHTYRRDSMRLILDALAEGELDLFVRVAYMIGAYHLFPSGNGRSVNQVRGFDKKNAIDDRFDLTLECIRLHYAGSASELSEVLDRYRDFFALFALFADFQEYVDFFLLQDLVDQDSGTVRYFLDGGFERAALPQNVDEYRIYSARATSFVLARNERMLTSARQLRAGR